MEMHSKHGDSQQLRDTTVAISIKMPSIVCLLFFVAGRDDKLSHWKSKKKKKKKQE